MSRFWIVRNVVVGLAVVGLGLVWLAAVTPAGAEDAPGADAAEYVGSKKCKMCHSKVFKSWEETGHAQAYEMLKPGERSEAKTKAKLDSAKDYTRDESCLACHVVGFGKRGGYQLVNWDVTVEKLVKKLGHVGCENCHGPGGEYTKLHKEIKKEKRTYKWSEMEEAGMTKITEETCTACHNDKSPTFDESKKLDFEAMKEKGSHKVMELKQREK